MSMEITFPGGKRVDAQYKGFTIKTDQAPHGGGEGSAPEPFSLFLASIGTCAAIYCLSFLQKRSLPTDRASVILDTEKDPTTRMISKIILTLNLPPEFPDKYRKAILRSVDLCAVKRHMITPPTFDINIELLSEE